MELHQVDLNLLVAFEALMAERSVTKAAQRLCVGQSAMSSTLGRLRKLFDEHFAAVCGLDVLDHVHFGGVTPGLPAEQVKLQADVVRAKAAELF